jgi:hypothetical protein
MTLWIYGDLNRGSDAGEFWPIWVVLVQLMLGFAVNRWWAVALPVVVVAISVPAGFPPITPSNYEPLPVWVGLAFSALFALPLVGLGVASRKLLASQLR